MSQVNAGQAEAQNALLKQARINGNFSSQQPPLPLQPQQLQQQQQPPPVQGQLFESEDPGEDSSDSESGIKSRDSYMQEGLERPRTPPKDG
uniref:Androgen receptor n=1 Tax=Panagrolaimus davidi TaxID=227884 RepID=A0A914QK67_9BILA